MILGRTGKKIKIKTDQEGGGLRAVNCACCAGCPQFSNLCVNALPLFGPIVFQGGPCSWQTDQNQCADDIFKCYYLYYYEISPGFCTGPGWAIYFFVDIGGGIASSAGAYKCGDDPYGTYTLFPQSPGTPPTISSCS